MPVLTLLQWQRPYGGLCLAYKVDRCQDKSAVTDCDIKTVSGYLPLSKPSLFSMDGTLVD